MSHFLRDTAHALGFDDPDGKAAESGDIFWAVAGAYSASVFIEIPVEDIVATVFDAPVTAIYGKEPQGICLLWSSTGDTADNVMGDFAGFFINKVSLDQEGLLHEVEVFILYENAPSLYCRNVGMGRHYSLPLDGGRRGGGVFHPSLCPFQGMGVSSVLVQILRVSIRP